MAILRAGQKNKNKVISLEEQKRKKREIKESKGLNLSRRDFADLRTESSAVQLENKKAETIANAPQAAADLRRKQLQDELLRIGQLTDEEIAQQQADQSAQAQSAEFTRGVIQPQAQNLLLDAATGQLQNSGQTRDQFLSNQLGQGAGAAGRLAIGGGAVALGGGSIPAASTALAKAKSLSTTSKTLLSTVGIGSIVGKITSNKRQQVKEANKNFTTSKTNLQQIQNDVNAGIISPEDAIDAYNIELANIRRSERTLKMMTKGAIGRDLSGALDELAAIEAFNRDLPRRNLRFEEALITPNPGAVLPTTTTEDVINEQ